ncbi:MAG TPA: tetratricopeptide repeat protein [Terracidiphilus sp.]|jgi:tol-pal system protein YbgF
MLTAHSLCNRFLAAGLLAVLVGWSPVPAHAANKEIVELQTQVNQLMDAVQRLQSTVDAKFGLIQHLVEQTADNANRVTASVDALQKRLEAQSEATNGKLDTASGQAQALNDSVDELKSRMAKLDKAIQDLQGQLQNVQSPAAGAPGQQPGTAGAPLPASPEGGSAAPSGSGGAPAGSQAPPLQETYQAGLRDFNTGKFQVAQGEFQDVLTYYPQDDLAGNAQFYLGEIAYQQKDYASAVKAYNSVLEGFAGSSKAPAAQLHKGLALLQQGKRDPGIRELRALIQRHPQTPEADQARHKLNSMGIRPVARP